MNKLSHTSQLKRRATLTYYLQQRISDIEIVHDYAFWRFRLSLGLTRYQFWSWNPCVAYCCKSHKNFSTQNNAYMTRHNKQYIFHHINTLASQDKSHITSLFRVKQTPGCSSSSLRLQDSCHHGTKPHCGVISLILDGSTKSMTTTPKCRNQCIDLLQQGKMVYGVIWNLHLHKKFTFSFSSGEGGQRGKPSNWH